MSDNFRAAKVCFYTSAVVLWAYAVAWGFRSNYPLSVTLAVTGVMAAVAAIALVLALRMVADRESAAATPTHAQGGDHSGRDSLMATVDGPPLSDDTKRLLNFVLTGTPDAFDIRGVRLPSIGWMEIHYAGPQGEVQKMTVSVTIDHA